jgi:pantoate--beta-alanine ligase
MTRLLRTRVELRDALASATRPIGLVPTMGWLHEGHRALMQRARADSATTVVTIFVNPRQFDPTATGLMPWKSSALTWSVPSRS